MASKPGIREQCTRERSPWAVRTQKSFEQVWVEAIKPSWRGWYLSGVEFWTNRDENHSHAEGGRGEEKKDMENEKSIRVEREEAVEWVLRWEDGREHWRENKSAHSQGGQRSVEILESSPSVEVIDGMGYLSFQQIFTKHLQWGRQ